MLYFIVALMFIFGKSKDMSDVQFYQDVKQYDKIDYSNSYDVIVENDTLELHNGQVLFDKGHLYISGYIDDRPTSAYFLGEGRFIFYPENEIEAQQIKRFYRTDTVDVEVQEFHFAFPQCSNFLDKYKDKGTLVDPPGRVTTKFKAMRKFPGGEFKYNLPVNLYKATLENRCDFLWVHARRDRFSHSIYFYNPYEDEQIKLYIFASNYKSPQLVSSITDSNKRDQSKDTRMIDLFDYDIDVNLTALKKSEIKCTMKFEVFDDSLKIAALNFPKKFVVDSVAGDVADSLSFIHDRGRPGVYVELSDYFYKGDTAEVTIYYRGDLFRQYLHYGIIQDYLTRWYPYNGFRQLSNYDLHYTVDPGTTFLSVGNVISDTVIDGKRHLNFKTPQPTAYASFNYGDFDSTAVTNTPIPITVYSLKKHKSILFGKGGINNVVKDIGDAYNYFSELIGPLPVDKIDIAPMAFDYGQSSSGLIHLADNTYDRNTSGIHDKYRAHELAHQWFGHRIHPQTYHDLWLSEGISEYLGALYVKNVKKDEKAFRRILKEWKKQVTKKGLLNGKKSIGYKAGPIWLGYRLLADPSPGDYEALVYYKAAFALYVLNEKLGDEKFHELLARLVRENENQSISTNLFMELTREYWDGSDAFFGRWIFGWEHDDTDFDLEH